MGIAEHWGDLQFSLECLNKGNAKRKFRHAIKYAFGGLCAYCRCNRATTLDHIKPRSKGGSNLRSNLLPTCLECNHSKGSENWLTWYQRQEFYHSIAEELIEEWIANKHYDLEEDDERRTNTRATVCYGPSEIGDSEDEHPSTREDCLAPT